MGKVPEYPHPVASSVSSRMMVELGMLTLVIAVAAAVIGGFLASAVFAVTSFIFAATVFVVWPIVRPFLKIFLGLLLGIFERVWDNVIDLSSDGGVFSKISEFYTFGGLSASLEVLKPIIIVLLTMVLLVRFTLSRRPKNFRKWVNVAYFCSFFFHLPSVRYRTDFSLWIKSERILINTVSFICRICGKGLIFHDLKRKLELMLVNSFF